MLVGRLFQVASPATLKARSPKVVFDVLGMFNNPCKVDADLNTACFSPTTTGVHSSVRYSGAMPYVERLEDGHAEFVLYSLGTS